MYCSITLTSACEQANLCEFGKIFGGGAVNTSRREEMGRGKWFSSNAEVFVSRDQAKTVAWETPASKLSYKRIYSINRPGRLLNFWTLRVGANSRWALIRGWALIKFSTFSASEVCLFCNKTINANNKTRRSNKARFL